MQALRHVVATLSLAAVMGGLLEPIAVQAADSKVYAGAACVPANGSSWSAANVTGGRLFNVSTGVMSVACPIVRDNTTAAFTNLEVVAIDRHSTQNVTCWGVSASRDGSSSVTTQLKSTTGDTSTGQVLTFASVTETDKGYFYLHCDLPPSEVGQGSGIASYYITEP